MKLLSSKNTIQYGQIVCEDCILDTSLINNLKIDKSERFISFDYDANESGSPLNLPFKAESAKFHLIITQNELHIGVLVEIDNETLNNHECFANECGDIEFSVRLTLEEKLSLLRYLVNELIITS